MGECFAGGHLRYLEGAWRDDDGDPVDAVEVRCRCKDCKHWMDFPNCGCTDFVKVCALAEYMIGANGYCLYGERMDGE